MIETPYTGMPVADPADWEKAATQIYSGNINQQIMLAKLLFKPGKHSVLTKKEYGILTTSHILLGTNSMVKAVAKIMAKIAAIPVEEWVQRSLAMARSTDVTNWVDQYYGAAERVRYAQVLAGWMVYDPDAVLVDMIPKVTEVDADQLFRLTRYFPYGLPAPLLERYNELMNPIGE
jgi:hypothetical protein